jgi:hypothetical protein
MLKIKKGAIFQENIKKFQNFIIEAYNEQNNSNYELSIVDLTDEYLEEVQKHNFIYMMSTFTNGSHEIHWYSKLVPISYSSDNIEYAYFPITQPKFNNIVRVTLEIECELNFSTKPIFEF